MSPSRTVPDSNVCMECSYWRDLRDSEIPFFRQGEEKMAVFRSLDAV